MITWAILGYLCVLWWLRREPVVNAVAVNWAVNQAGVLANDGYANLPAFVLVDFLCALWLILVLGTRQARQVAAFFLPMIALNAAAFAAKSVPEWHHTALFGLAWLQLLWVVLGVVGDGILENLDNTRGRVRHSLSRASALFRGRK